jgi:subtilase family serine protease
MARLSASMAAAAPAGITVFVVSGDHGAYDCVDQDREDLAIAVDSPASDPNVVGVGGTYLTMQPDGTVIARLGLRDGPRLPRGTPLARAIVASLKAAP